MGIICQKNQTQINKDNIRKNRHRVDHHYKVVDKVMINKHTIYKYEMQYTAQFLITRRCTNGTVSLKIGTTYTRYDTPCIEPYKSDTQAEYFSSKIISDVVSI